MKKLACLLLTALLLCAQMTALAEGGYVHVKESIDSVFGKGISVPADEEESGSLTNLVILDIELYSDDVSVLLIGYNERGVYETTYWTTDSIGNNLALAAALCSYWDEMEGSLDEGYTLVYAFRFSEDSDRHFIYNAEEADAFVSVVLAFLQPDEE